jgi:hypothetical protein
MEASVGVAQADSSMRNFWPSGIILKTLAPAEANA